METTDFLSAEFLGQMPRVDDYSRQTGLPDYPLKASAYSIGEFVRDAYRSLYEMNAPYQRGSVWTDDQRRRLFVSLLIGAPIPALVINDRTLWKGRDFEQEPIYAVIDGKQRIEALRAIFDGEVSFPAWWIDEKFRPAGVDPNTLITAKDANPIMTRSMLQRPISVVQGRLPSEFVERIVFDLVNSAGTPVDAEILSRNAAVLAAGNSKD